MTRAARGGFALIALALVSCAGPPWFMGSPLDGHVAIPPWNEDASYKEHRAAAASAQSRGETVLELRALVALDDLERLTPANQTRLVTLLRLRAQELHALGRPIPESRDLERLARLAPARGAGLLGERAAAARAAGDDWLALGAVAEARAAYERASALGAADMDFRVRALWGHPPPEMTTLAELRAAIAALPLRAVPPFVAAYLVHGGGDAATLEKGLAAARQEHDDALAAALVARSRPEAPTGAAHDEAAALSDSPDGGAQAPTSSTFAAGSVGAPDAASSGARGASAGASPATAPTPAEIERWLLEGPTLEARLLPFAAAHPEVLDDVARAVWWVDVLLAEDESSPDVLAFAALVFGRAGRFGGTERMLMELTYATPDRAAGLARAAGVWERLGRDREACVQWIRAARWRDEPDDPTWRTAIACARREPNIADWRELRAYVLDRAAPARRASLAASLDGAAGVTR